ncbi:MAG: tetratricopeptide repeat protein [Verrucomicrobia bacterium]|nr:tetratricopeptide repeat protein [Verrucomicrobiota bacterium]
MAPDEATFLIHAAIMAFQLGRLSEAEELARRGTRCTKGFPEEAWHNLGGYLVAQERYDEALFCYEKALGLDPEYALALVRRAELLEVLAYPGTPGMSSE